MRKLVLKKCMKCGALIKVIDDCTCDNCGIKCCDRKMIEIKSNSVDAAFEKHVPTYYVDGGKIIVKVNHVMDDDHYIEWICLVTEEKEEYKYFNSGDDVICEFDNVKEGIIYSYCNNHGLWKNSIK